MLEIKKKKPPVLTPVRLGFTIVLVILLWTGLQLTLPSLMDSVYFKFFLVCFLGFGFLFISFMLKYG